jgi:plastocyanin
MRLTRRVLTAGVLLAAVSLVGCEQQKRAPRIAQIVVDQLAFGKSPDDLHVGDTVQWVNHDMFEHTATAKDGQFDLDLPPGSTRQVVLQRTGIIQYYCKFHTGMTGQMTVSD